MKRYLTATVITVLSLGLFCGLSPWSGEVQAHGEAAAEKITVLNPLGTPPPVQLSPMAPRLDTLDGKTIYFVNTGFIGTDRLMEEMMDWFKANHPKTTLEYRRSGAGMTGVDKKLWAEINEKGDAAIIGLGH
ncbi:MAG TPA: hypothetical protein VLL97_14055 [Acidobacteriota bacterium]|nr:hypothetical protein [Acidobacteriota bacterium]